MIKGIFIAVESFISFDFDVPGACIDDNVAVEVRTIKTGMTWFGRSRRNQAIKYPHRQLTSCKSSSIVVVRENR